MFYGVVLSDASPSSGSVAVAAWVVLCDLVVVIIVAFNDVVRSPLKELPQFLHFIGHDAVEVEVKIVPIADSVRLAEPCAA